MDDGGSPFARDLRALLRLVEVVGLEWEEGEDVVSAARPAAASSHRPPEAIYRSLWGFLAAGACESSLPMRKDAGSSGNRAIVPLISLTLLTALVISFYGLEQRLVSGGYRTSRREGSRHDVHRYADPLLLHLSASGAQNTQGGVSQGVLLGPTQVLGKHMPSSIPTSSSHHDQGYEGRPPIGQGVAGGKAGKCAIMWCAMQQSHAQCCTSACSQCCKCHPAACASL